VRVSGPGARVWRLPHPALAQGQPPRLLKPQARTSTSQLPPKTRPLVKPRAKTPLVDHPSEIAIKQKRRQRLAVRFPILNLIYYRAVLASKSLVCFARLGVAMGRQSESPQPLNVDEADERELARIASALAGNGLDGADHVAVWPAQKTAWAGVAAGAHSTARKSSRFAKPALGGPPHALERARWPLGAAIQSRHARNDARPTATSWLPAKCVSLRLTTAA